MDIETLTIMSQSITAWCKDNATLIDAIEGIDAIESSECQHAFSSQLYDALDGMGLLSVLGDPCTRHEIHTVAEIAYQLSRYSPSIAVMTIQQNLACWLLAEANAPAPTGWVALPLFDAVEEWRFQRLHSAANRAAGLNGCWQSLPLLPVATHVLLPLPAQHTEPFRLVALSLRDAPPDRIQVSPSIVTLGLRGCPHADLVLVHAPMPDDAVLMQGQKALAKIETLWSQAEVCTMAIRAGIAESSYLTARNYANQRYQGGKIIIRHSLIRKILTDFYREKCVIDDNWRTIALSLRPGERLSHGQMGTALNSGEKLPWLTSDGIQILGGVGYMEEYAQERRYRDAKQCEFLLGHPQARNFSLWKTEGE